MEKGFNSLHNLWLRQRLTDNPQALEDRPDWIQALADLRKAIEICLLRSGQLLTSSSLRCYLDHMMARPNVGFNLVLCHPEAAAAWNSLPRKAVTADDIENIESLAASPDVLRQLAASLAPSIYGHDLVKLGLVLQLLGGRERELAESGTRLRGCAAVFFGFFFLVFFSLPSLSFFSRPDKTHAPSSLE